MKLAYFFLVLFVCGCAATPQADGTLSAVNNLPQGALDNAAAIERRQTADADALLAAQANRRATESANAARQAELKLTAVAQVTRDTLSVRATTDAQNATATAYVADASATAQMRAAIQTATENAIENAIAATARSERLDGTATAVAQAATDRAQRIEATVTARAVEGTRVSEQATATVAALQVSATATRTANQVNEENNQTYWRNFFAPVQQVAWVLLPIGLFYIGLRLLALWESRNRIVQRGTAVVLLTPGHWNVWTREYEPPRATVLTQCLPEPKKEKTGNVTGLQVIDADATEEWKDSAPTGPPLVPPTPQFDSVTAQELKTSSTNEANEQFRTALKILDATLVQLSKELADGEKLTSKPFAYDACAAAKFVQTWEEWGRIMDLWQAAGIATRPRVKSGWRVNVSTVREGESLLTELFVRTGYIRMNGVWMKR